MRLSLALVFFIVRFVTEIMHQQTVRPFSPLIISSYYFFRPCVSYLKDQTQADSATIFTRLTNRGRPPSAIMTHCALSRQCYTHCSRWFLFHYFFFFFQVRMASFYLLFDWYGVECLYFIRTHCALSLNCYTHCVRLHPLIITIFVISVIFHVFINSFSFLTVCY